MAKKRNKEASRECGEGRTMFVQCRVSAAEHAKVVKISRKLGDKVSSTVRRMVLAMVRMYEQDGHL